MAIRTDGSNTIALMPSGTVKRIELAVAILLLVTAMGITWYHYGPSIPGQRPTQPVSHRESAAPEGSSDEGVDPNSKSNDGWPLLIEAAYRNQSDRMIELIKAGADVNEPGPGGWTALMQAAGNGHYEATRLLLDHGASISDEDALHRTAHDLALRRGYLTTGDLLTEAGALSRDGRQLIAAVCEGHLYEVRELLDAGVPIDGVDASGQTALFYALAGDREKRYTDSSFDLNPELIDLLLGAGADLNHRDRQGRIPLLAFLDRRWDTDVVRMLLDAGADPTARDQRGRSALHRRCRLETATLLIESGAPLEATDQAGRTPLHYQIAIQDPKVVAKLLESGADPTPKDHQGRTPPEVFPDQPASSSEYSQKSWRDTREVLVEHGLLKPNHPHSNAP